MVIPSYLQLFSQIFSVCKTPPNMLHLLILVVTCRVGSSQGETSPNIDTVREVNIGNEYQNSEEEETLNYLNKIEKNVEHQAQIGNSSEV